MTANARARDGKKPAEQAGRGGGGLDQKSAKPGVRAWSGTGVQSKASRNPPDVCVRRTTVPVVKILP